MLNSLKKTKEFKHVYENGKSYADKRLVLYVLKNEIGICRVGISASKKVGGSVNRNRLKRLIRESMWRALKNELAEPFGADLIFVLRKSASDKSFNEIYSSVVFLLKKHKLIKTSELNFADAVVETEKSEIKKISSEKIDGENEKGIIKNIIIKILHWYKKSVSPLLPPACRYTPTCSEYTLQAVKKYGALKGLAMGFLRILRCNPFFKGGYDPVP